MAATTVRVSPGADTRIIRSEMEVRTGADGAQEIVAVREYALVDGEWIDVLDLIAVWRAR